MLDFCQENGIVLLSFPPHTTNHLQPLDVSVYDPFKTLYYEYTAANGWIDSHPGVPISIYDITAIVKEALPLAATPKNIFSGFKKTSIWPYNRNTFTNEDYLCTSVTDIAYTTDGENHNSETPIINQCQNINTNLTSNILQPLISQYSTAFTNINLQYTTALINTDL